MNPKYPIYIVSKGRFERRLTATALEKMKVPYRFIVEEFEFDKYAEKVGKERVLILPQSYLDNYDTCDDLGATKSKGPGAARNFAWDHSINEGHKKHWVMDDNIASFARLNNNLKIICDTGSYFRACEDFVDRYENVPISGLNYTMFAKRKDKIPPFVLNTRIYSCLLIQNDIPYRWRGRYNEDTDLSLRVLKDGFCTIQFNAFLQDKMTTQVMKGGNTDAFYAKEGTTPKSEMIEKLHPDVARVLYRFSRVHHFVDYGVFKRNRLIKRKDVVIMQKNNEYGMILVNIGENT
jgi:hypothetical protein